MRQTFDRKVPKWKQLLAVMLKKAKRNHPKRHNTTKASKAIRKAKKLKFKARIEANLKRARAHKKQAAAYWRGEADEHP